LCAANRTRTGATFEKDAQQFSERLVAGPMSKTKKRESKKGSGSRARYWSARVTKQSDALDLEANVFKKATARQIALSLKRSAGRSTRRKSTPYQSAMSMLNFYINRAGKNLPAKRKHILEKAKDELRDIFGRT
jgi:hypothetical protein